MSCITNSALFFTGEISINTQQCFNSKQFVVIILTVNVFVALKHERHRFLVNGLFCTKLQSGLRGCVTSNALKMPVCKTLEIGYH